MSDLRVTKRASKIWTDGLKCQGAAESNFVALLLAAAYGFAQARYGAL
jgi:hypothetical protein